MPLTFLLVCPFSLYIRSISLCVHMCVVCASVYTYHVQKSEGVMECPSVFP